MARHQRTGNTPIVTRARAAESAFQLELPGEAGIAPPKRESTEPSAWIIEGEVHKTGTPYEVQAPANFRPRPRPPQGPEGAPSGPLGGTETAPLVSPPAPTVPGSGPQLAGPAAPAPPKTQPLPADPPQAPKATPAAAVPSPAPTPEPARPLASPLEAMTPPAEAKPVSAPETSRLDQPPALPPPEPEPPARAAEPPPPQVIFTGPPIDERILAEATSRAASTLADAERERLGITEKARAEAGKIVESARAEREQVLAQAKKEAAALVEEARQIREGAHAEGHREGFEAGQVDARAHAYAEMEAHVGELIAAIQRITQDALDERHKSLDVLEPEVVGLALEIAEKLITRETTMNPDMVAAVARDCIGRVRDRQEIIIHAHAADIETLQRYRDQFIRLEDLGSLRIVEDSRVGMRGGILLETSGGEIDARMETQLERIRQEFDRVMESDDGQ